MFFLLCFHCYLCADWKKDVSRYLSHPRNYKEAVNYLKGHFEKIDEFNKPAACVLLAFLYNRLETKQSEYKWIKEYFETYWGRNAAITFLDDSSSEEISEYLSSWKEKYPLVMDIALIKGEIYSQPAPPAKVVLGVDITNDAFYKLYDVNNVIEGGLFKKGFNLISIEAYNFFEKSGVYRYFLDLKADDLILKKEIEIDIQLDLPQIVEKSNVAVKKGEYKVSMFRGDELVLSRKKISLHKITKKIMLPPTDGVFRPYGPVPLDKSAPSLNSFPIMSLPGLAYSLIKKLVEKEKEKPRTSSIQKVKRITATFKRKGSEGIERDINVVILLKYK